MEEKKIIKNNNKLFILVIIIVSMLFMYFSYKIETGDFLFYKDTITGERLQDIGAKKICYTILIILSVYTVVISEFLQEKMKENKIKIENIFLCIVPVFCILLMLAMPITKGHDETIHALRIYGYAEGKWVSNGKTSFLEEGVINALDNINIYNDIFNKEKNYSTNTETIEWGDCIATYSPVNYLPQVLGIFVSRFITTNSMVHLYVARICNIITCVAILYFAIKLIPFGKNLLLVFSIIPISIEGFSTMSADGMLVSVSLLWISYILYLCFTKGINVEKKDIFILLLIGIIIGLSKTIYIVLLPLLLIIPKEKWGNTKKKILVIGLICIVSAILDIVWYFVGVQEETLLTGNDALNYIISNPLLYIQKIIYSIITNFGKYISEIFGARLEWNEVIAVNVFPYILLIMSVIITIKGEDKINWSIWQKIIITIIILSCIVLVFTSMFLAFARTDINDIKGVQGRYFMPIIPLVFLLFGRKFSDDKSLTNAITTIGLIMQIYVIMEIIFHHI